MSQLTPLWLSGIPQAPPDSMFGLSAAYRADENPSKVDLGVGAYRDDSAQPWVLPSVKKAKARLAEQQALNHEYLPIEGLAPYLEASQRLMLGNDSTAISEGKVASVQTISGTNALHLGALFLARFFPQSEAKRVYLSNPPYVNHSPILQHVSLPTGSYPYYSAATKSLDFDSLVDGLTKIPDGSIILLQACAHNPTGVDPTRDQWKKIAGVVKKKKMLPFFDSAYQGFASGDIDDDAWVVRYFVDQGFDLLMVAQSYAKNFGLYGERVGCLHMITSSADTATKVFSQLRRLQRVDISTPPAFGARIVSTILNDKKLFAEWLIDLKSMSGRISSMRKALKSQLVERGAADDWSHITNQVGMFCYSGLNEFQVHNLRDKWHIYLTKDGRISVSGLNTRNVAYVGKAITEVASQTGTNFSGSDASTKVVSKL